MDAPQERATVHVSLRRGQDAPPLDVQLTEGFRAAAEAGVGVGRVAGAVAGPLNETRQGQVIRLFEQLRAGALPASVAFGPTDPVDLAFLGGQARAHGFSITVAPTHITVTTSRDDASVGSPPT